MIDRNKSHKKLRVFAAIFGAETNSFSPIPTSLRSFEEEALYEGRASIDDGGPIGDRMRLLRRLAETDGHHFLEGLSASALPAGLLTRSTYEALRGRLITGLEAAMPVDAIIVSMHGAMMADGYDDCEGDMLRHIRALVGSRATVGVILDPHCHMTGEMVAHADLIACFKSYPHVDILDTTEHVYAITLDAALGKTTPVRSVYDCRMIGLFPTGPEPMASIVDELRRVERQPGILSVSFIHGFPWSDNADIGAKVLVISDGDETSARDRARSIGQMIYDRRHELVMSLPSIPAAIAKRQDAERPSIFADAGDNPGGGAPGDATPLLAALLQTGWRFAIGPIFDPTAVDICHAVGIGARIEIRVGGKCGRASGAPVDLFAEVVALSDDHHQLRWGSLSSLGRSAWIRTGNANLILVSLRSQAYSPELFTRLGVDLKDMRIIAVKSLEHFRSAFTAVTEEIEVVATPGALDFSFADIPYAKLQGRDMYPLVDDPLPECDRAL